MSKPIIIFYDELIEPINRAKSELNELKENILNIEKEFLIKSVFAYSFAILESSLSECLGRYLNMIPQKLSFDKLNLTKHKDTLIDESLSHKLISLIIEDYLISIGYGKLEDFLSIFCDLLNISKVDNYYEGLNEKKERRNLLLHNNLVVNNKYIQNTKCSPNQRGKQLNVSVDYVLDTINCMLKILSDLKSKIDSKYIRYTRLETIKRIWEYLFSTPLLIFEKSWIIEDERILGFNLDGVKRYAGSLSSSEKTFLAYWLQNFSNTINDELFKFRDMSMQISLGDEKFIFLVELFDKYPLLLQDINIKCYE